MVNVKPDIFRAVALVLDNKGRLLISKDKKATLWQILGGGVEDGESQIECLKRELKEGLDAEIEVNPKMYNEAPAYPALDDPDDPGKTVKHFYYFCKLLTRPKFVENVQFIHYLTKRQAESGKFEFSDTTKNYLLPMLIKDKILL